MTINTPNRARDLLERVMRSVDGRTAHRDGAGLDIRANPLFDDVRGFLAEPVVTPPADEVGRAETDKWQMLAFDRLRGWNMANERTRIAEAALKLAVEALEKARDQFLSYAAQHYAKSTPEATAKAVVNDGLALDMENAIRSISSLRHEDMPLAPGGDA